MLTLYRTVHDDTGKPPYDNHDDDGDRNVGLCKPDPGIPFFPKLRFFPSQIIFDPILNFGHL